MDKMPPTQILGASDIQESGLDKEIVERNVEAMRNKKSEELEAFSDFNWETFEAFLTWRNREDIDSIPSGTRTDGDCSESEAISSLYESDNIVHRPPLIFSARSCFGVDSDNRVVIQQPSDPHISQNLEIPGFVEHAASWRDDWGSGSDKGIGESNVQGRRDGKSFEEVLEWSRADWNWDYIQAYNSSGTNEMQGTKFREDIDSIVSGTNTDGFSENEALSHFYESDNTVQRPGFSFSENGEWIKRNSWGDIGSARKHYRSISGASRAESQQMGSVPKTPFYTRSSFPPLSVSPYPDNSTTLHSNALSADLSMEDCNGNSHSSLTSSPFFRCNCLMVGESLPTCKVHECSFTCEGNTEEIVHSATEIIVKEAVHHIGHNLADQREAQKSKREEESEKNISRTHESLSQHFGRPLDDARKSFGVSRTAFKAMCRDVGIMRWKYGKRNMGRNSSETRRRKNDEVPGKRNFSSGMPPVQFAPVAHTSQNLNKMIVKAKCSHKV